MLLLLVLKSHEEDKSIYVHMHIKVTSAQFRMARAALEWTVRDLAAKAGVHRNTIARIEAGEASHGPTLAAVQRALEDAGIIFLSAGEQTNGGPGVRLREPEET